MEFTDETQLTELDNEPLGCERFHAMGMFQHLTNEAANRNDVVLQLNVIATQWLCVHHQESVVQVLFSAPLDPLETVVQIWRQIGQVRVVRRSRSDQNNQTVIHIRPESVLDFLHYVVH